MLQFSFTLNAEFQKVKICMRSKEIQIIISFLMIHEPTNFYLNFKSILFVVLNDIKKKKIKLH